MMVRLSAPGVNEIIEYDPKYETHHQAIVRYQKQNATPTDPIVAQVCADLHRRSAVGLAKYGVTLARTDLTHRQWLQHAYEEALDTALYLRRAMQDLDEAGAPAGKDTP